MWNKAPSYPARLDRMRRKEYPMLQGTTYLDHAGTTLYAKSLIKQFSKEMSTNLFGNPHSASPSSRLATRRVEDTRLRVLDFFKADPDLFDVIFVANATAAIKLVMDAFRDHSSDGTWKPTSGFSYYYHRDCHTSLVGVREIASSSYCFGSDEAVENWLTSPIEPIPTQMQDLCDQIRLFAYPAQSNMNGHRLPLNWPGRVRISPYSRHENVYTLLDAAAYVATAQLDLSDAINAPDFTALSFYKIFGFPDLGALIVRKEAGHVLQKRKYFGGGTVEMVTALETQWYAKKTGGLHEQLEDGTLPFHNIIALDHALNILKRLYGSMDRITQHTCHLARILYDGLARLQHANGVKVCSFYKDINSEYGDSKTQAPTVAFNVRNYQGGWVGKSDFERLAIQENIQLRSGGVCNPGGIASSLGLASWELRKNFTEGVRCGNDFDILGGKPTGIVRASLGAMSTMQDVETLIKFVKGHFVEGRDHLEGVFELQPPMEPSFYIDSLKIYPIKGCPGWKIPVSAAWDIKAEGLAWDQEWCLVSLINGSALRQDEHPNMALLRPSVALEKGILWVEIQSQNKDLSVEPSDISVSLWEIPQRLVARENQSLLLEGLHHNNSNAIPYDSTKVASFFTSVVGIPCTLARFQIDRSYDLQEKIPSPGSQLSRPVLNPLRFKPLLLAGSTTLSWKSNVLKDDASDDSRTNLALHPCRAVGEPFNCRNDCQYFQIGPHYFQTSNSSPCSPSSHRRIIHLPNIKDGSPASQNPTIRVGDLVRTISEMDSKEDKNLQFCIQFLATAGFFTPSPPREKPSSIWKSFVKSPSS